MPEFTRSRAIDRRLILPTTFEHVCSKENVDEKKSPLRSNDPQRLARRSLRGARTTRAYRSDFPRERLSHLDSGQDRRRVRLLLARQSGGTRRWLVPPVAG